VLPDNVHAPAGPVEVASDGASTPVVGKTSVMINAFATVATGPFIEPGPLFLTIIVHVIVSFLTTRGVGLASLVIERS
jgi:hypothetical protein